MNTYKGMQYFTPILHRMPGRLVLHASSPASSTHASKRKSPLVRRRHRVYNLSCMKGILLVCLSLLMLAEPLAAQSAVTTPGLAFGPTLALDTESDALGLDSEDWFKKKKKKRKHHKRNTFAIGAVSGGPLGFGGRTVFRIGIFGIAGDFAYNRIRNDYGLKVDALAMKVDARLYSNKLIGKILRTYTFAGMTSQRGRFDGAVGQSVYSMDAGFGAGIKLWKLEVAAEAGVLIPVRQLEAYRPGFGAFVNASVLVWLF